MSKPPRTVIREAVAQRLAAHLPAVDARITPQRIHVHRATPLASGRLPAILIYAQQERIEEQPHADPGLRYRKLDVAVDIVAGGATAADDVDTLAQAVEAILDQDETLGRLVEGTRLLRIEIDQDGEGETPVLAARLTFEVSYWTKPIEEEGRLPLHVLYSWGPKIGIPHEPDYVPLTDPPPTP